MAKGHFGGLRLVDFDQVLFVVELFFCYFAISLVVVVKVDLHDGVI